MRGDKVLSIHWKDGPKHASQDYHPVIVVSGLTEDTTEDLVQELIETCVSKVHAVSMRTSGCHVTVDSWDDADSAIERLDGHEHDGQRLHVALRTKQPLNPNAASTLDGSWAARCDQPVFLGGIPDEVPDDEVRITFDHNITKRHVAQQKCGKKGLKPAPIAFVRES
jgi:hypothetical protein